MARRFRTLRSPIPAAFLRQARWVPLSLVLAWSPARAGPLETWTILPIRILDTSGEPRDQTADHAARLVAMEEELTARLRTKTGGRLVALSSEALATACPEPSMPCILAAARQRGADLAFVGVVHKSSTLIMQMFARIVDTSSGLTLFTRDLNFRGDNDEAWRRMMDFLAREIENDPISNR